MRDLTKYKGIIPAFYAAYKDDGSVDENATRQMAKFLVDKGVLGLYVCGSSGECIYQNLEERMLIAKLVIEEVGDRATIIVHVGGVCTNDAKTLAKHAESLGADAIASIPPIYFRLPNHSVIDYWNEISSAAPNTDFIIYNIPQLAGTALDRSVLTEMLKNKQLVGVKNSSMPVMDIELFKEIGGDDFVVFNGPDEQYLAGRVIGADGGIGGTYAVMPELFLEIDKAICECNLDKARKIQATINRVIEVLVSLKGNLYAGLKGVLRLQGLEVGGVRPPMTNLCASDEDSVKRAYEMIETAKREFSCYKPS